MKKKVSYYFIYLTFFLFSFNVFGSSTPKTCTWVNAWDPSQTEKITTQIKSRSGGETIYETCKEAIQRKQTAVDKAKALQNRSKLINSGGGSSKHPCTWTSPDLPLAPAKTYVLTRRQIGTDEDGNPEYESCQNAKKRRSEKWVKDEFGGHRDDAMAAIAAESEKRASEAEKKTLAAGEKARRASQKQQKTSMVTSAGSMAAGLTATACYSSCGTTGGGCCAAAPYFAALSAGLGMVSMLQGMASSDNAAIAHQYDPVGGLMSPPDTTTGDTTNGETTNGDTTTGDTTNGDTTTGETTNGDTTTNGETTNGGTTTDDNTTGGDTTGGDTTGGNTTSVTVNDGGSDGSVGGGGELTPPDYTPSKWEENAPVIKLPNGELVKASPKHIESYLKKKGLTWNPKTGKVTLPNGQSYTGDDAEKFKAAANSPAAAALNRQIAGLKKQIDAAVGDTGIADSAAADGSMGAGKSGMGGGGFSSYGKGSSDGRRKHLMAAFNPGQKTGSGKNPDLSGMSVKHGKNQVGVSQDNIFEIIHRRYQAKRKRQHFIEISK